MFNTCRLVKVSFLLCRRVGQPVLSARNQAASDWASSLSAFTLLAAASRPDGYLSDEARADDKYQCNAGHGHDIHHQLPLFFGKRCPLCGDMLSFDMIHGTVPQVKQSIHRTQANAVPVSEAGLARHRGQQPLCLSQATAWALQRFKRVMAHPGSLEPWADIGERVAIALYYAACNCNS